MRVRRGVLIAAACALGLGGVRPWGFYAHREINRQAAFTLPAELAGFYKANLAYVSAHAVDPDKRRYAAALEGPRHFVDLERFGGGTVAELPRDFWAFHERYTALACVRGGDTLGVRRVGDTLRVGHGALAVWPDVYAGWYRGSVLPAYYREEAYVDADLPRGRTGDSLVCEGLVLTDTMMRHGVLPYHLVAVQRQLTAAFLRGDWARALQLSAELGHYVADATVPLHTTENYDGQLTGQRGVHAFWESRLPELFLAEDYDLLVGPASYIDDPGALVREIIAESHALVDSVLAAEAHLRATLPAELQDCYEERLGRIARVPCRAFARAYADRLGGSVEARFRRAVSATGSLWYTAWVDAGMPPVGGVGEVAVADTSLIPRPGAEGRGH